MKKLSKKEAQRYHALKRLKERFGILSDFHEYRLLCEYIKTGQGVYVTRQSNTRSVWRIKYRGISMQAVYDSSRGTIVTFLPDHVEVHQERREDQMEQLYTQRIQECAALSAAGGEDDADYSE